MRRLLEPSLIQRKISTKSYPPYLYMAPQHPKLIYNGWPRRRFHTPKEFSHQDRAAKESQRRGLGGQEERKEGESLSKVIHASKSLSMSKKFKKIKKKRRSISRIQDSMKINQEFQEHPRRVQENQERGVFHQIKKIIFIFIQDYQEEFKMNQEPIKKDSLHYIKRRRGR